MTLPPDLTERQKWIDTFYWKHGKCCAGCDHWRHLNAVTGECTRTAPVSGRQRVDMLAYHTSSSWVESGHLMTWRRHVCGEFEDSFDWSSLPLGYRKAIGALT